VRDDIRYKKALSFLVCGITLFAAVSVFQFITDPTRLTGAQSSISIAGMCTTAIIVIAATDWRRSLLGKLAFIVVAAGLLASFSRGYILLAIFSPILYFVVRRGKAVVLISSIIIGSLCGTIMLATAPDILKVDIGLEQQRTDQTVSRLTDTDLWLNSIYGRGVHYNNGFREFLKSPIIGNGFHKGGEQFGPRAVVWHNFHVEWLEYGGLIAYLLYVSLLILHFRKHAKLARHNHWTAINLTMISILLLNALTNSFTVGMTPYLAYMFMGLSNATLAIAARTRRHDAAPAS